MTNTTNNTDSAAYRPTEDDDDEWCANTWHAEFEIGGITIYDTGERVASPASAHPCIDPVQWLLYEHDDGRYAVAPTAEQATFTIGEPAWHRIGPVEIRVPASAQPPVALTDEQITQIALGCGYTMGDVWIPMLRDFAAALLAKQPPVAVLTDAQLDEIYLVAQDSRPLSEFREEAKRILSTGEAQS